MDLRARPDGRAPASASARVAGTGKRISGRRFPATIVCSPAGSRIGMHRLPAPRGNLPEGEDAESSSGKPGDANALKFPRTTRRSRGESAPWIVRTAMAVEARNGKLNVFMPPIKVLEDYLDLVAAIEETADVFKHPRHHRRLRSAGGSEAEGRQGHSRPRCHRGEYPARRIVARDDRDHDRARRGRAPVPPRHGEVHDRWTPHGHGWRKSHRPRRRTPADSPILRRSDVLRSLVNYWHNHPSLSYLFSGLFVGPTCQSPRVDEARNDALYELEIAFKQIPDRAEVPPWLVDRIFRNLLIDVTGNTHRAEFCIDKLFSPDGPTGRLGLLELRAFEMPPHARMSLDASSSSAFAARGVLGASVSPKASAVGHRVARPLHAAAFRLAGFLGRHR